jgi:hypothetical protein
MNTPPQSSAAAFVDLINDEYREVIKAESGALPHALKCGDYLNRAKESVKSEKRQKWSEWLKANCEISQETASVYMRLDEFKDLIQKKKAKTIAEAREIIREHRQRTREKSAEKRDDADKPAGGFDPSNDKPGPAIQNHQLADLGADELSTMLIAQWEDDALRELAKRINDHLTKKSSLLRPEISSAATNPAPAVRRPIA